MRKPNEIIVPSVIENTELFNDVCQIIDQARRHVASFVNVEACLMNWHVGKRIKEDVLYNKRAEYGKEILKNLSFKLTAKYGTGWGTEKLKHCVRSAYLFSEDEIMYATRTQLTWTHLRSLMAVKDSLERQFYVGHPVQVFHSPAVHDEGAAINAQRRNSHPFIFFLPVRFRAGEDASPGASVHRLHIWLFHVSIFD